MLDTVVESLVPLQMLLHRHPRADQSRVRRGDQPYRQAVEVIAHAALVAQATREATGHEEVGEARHHATGDIHTASPAHRQHVVAGDPTEQAATARR